jgi:hypothetical protein
MMDKEPLPMTAARPLFLSGHGLFLSVLILLKAGMAVGGELGRTVSEADPATVRAYFADSALRVLTFLGYSGAGYEDPAAMLEHARRVLDRYDPKATLVNSGATAEGIGAVYSLAKQKGFRTTGIVSAKALIERVALSPHVDRVFFVRDTTWGGFLAGTAILSPTSQAMVENSDVIVAIGGGDVARDEIIAAKRLGKLVEFIPADLNHRQALEKAGRQSRPAPTDFGGTAATAPLRRR